MAVCMRNENRQCYERGTRKGTMEDRNDASACVGVDMMCSR